MNFWNYIISNYPQILSLLIEHLKLTAISVGLAILIGVPLGIFISFAAKASKPILAVANVIQAIPSMALLGFMIPLLGIGVIPAIVAVVLYSLLPIIKNTYTGIDNINPQTLEAAKGIGLTPFQVLTKVQIPLALPVIMAGVRIASVTAVGLMTMAAFIGAGGLGYLVFSGIRTVNNNQILAGAIPACLLALMVDFLIGLTEKLVTPVSLQKGDASVKKKKQKYPKGNAGSGCNAGCGYISFHIRWQCIRGCPYSVSWLKRFYRTRDSWEYGGRFNRRQNGYHSKQKAESGRVTGMLCRNEDWRY